jgi:hypothetical protein
MVNSNFMGHQASMDILEKSKISIPIGKTNFLSSPKNPDSLRPTQPPIQSTPPSLSGLKWPGREADHKPPSSREVKNK